MPETISPTIASPIYIERLSKDTDFAMAEISRFFESEGKVYETLRRITTKLESLGVAYAVSGGLALGRYGFVRATDDVDILTSRDGLSMVHERLNGLGYVHVFRGSKAMRDVTSGVKVVFLISGQFPGDGKPKPVAFPDPEEAGVLKDGIRFLRLEPLIELKLASGMTAEHRGKDLIDVQELITRAGLDCDFAGQLAPYVRDAFHQCWVKTRKRFFRILRLDEFADRHAMERFANELRQAGVEVDERKGDAADWLASTEDAAVADRYAMYPSEEFIDPSSLDFESGR